MNRRSSRNSVLLVHGIWDTGKIFHQMSSYLSSLGWSVYTLDLSPNNGDSPLEHLAEQVEDFISRTFPRSMPLDLVGFSMGGIVSRYYVQRLGGLARVQRFITLSSPHKGTWLAYGSYRPGCTQMRPDSQFLNQLNSELKQLEQINFTSIWTPLDTMIIPASSSQLPVGRNIPLLVPLHAQMVTDIKSLSMVAEALREPLRQSGEDLSLAKTV